MGSGAPAFLRLSFSVSVRPFTPAAAMRSASSPADRTHSLQLDSGPTQPRIVRTCPRVLFQSAAMTTAK